VREWAGGLAEVGELIGDRFARSEPRENAVEYIKGLLSEEERKNSWTLSERAGHRVPDRMRRLLSTTDWDPGGLGDDLRSYVVEKIGDPDGVLVVDETGFLKKGIHSAGLDKEAYKRRNVIKRCFESANQAPEITAYSSEIASHMRTDYGRNFKHSREGDRARTSNRTGCPHGTFCGTRWLDRQD
jgi:SRSO17 transposase